MKILWGILILAVIIITHEMGHYLIARLNGIEVVEFTIGFGPKIIGWKTKSGTKFSVRLIMLGAACVFDDLDAGPDDDDMDIASLIANSSFRKANVWARIATTIAGPFFNLLLAYVLGLFLMNYIDIPSTVITQVVEGGAAYEAGVVSLILIAIVTAVIFKLIKDKKNGISSCGGNCKSCGMCSSCNRTDKK